MYTNFNSILLVKQKYFSSCTFLFSLKNPNYYILKLDMENLLSNMYFAMVTVICKIKVNGYNGKTLLYTLLT